MNIVAVVFIILVAIVIVITMPRFSVFLIWPFTLCYPQALTFGILPMNAGVDDIFIALVAIRLLLKRQYSLRYIAANRIVMIAVAFILMDFFSQLFGLFRYPFLYFQLIKDVLKGGVLLLFTFIFVIDGRTESDLRRHLKSLLIATILSGTIVIGCYFSPIMSKIWQVKSEHDVVALAYVEGTASNRVYGPFLGPGEIGTFGCAVIPICLGIIIFGGTDIKMKQLAVMAVMAVSVTILLAKSRNGILGLSAMLISMLMFSDKKKHVLIGFLILAFCASTLSFFNIEILHRFAERFEATKMLSDLNDRIAIWGALLGGATPSILLFGEGYHATFLRLGTSPHNGFLDAILLWGVFGVLTFSTVIILTIRFCRRILAFDSAPLSKGLSWAILWMLVAEGASAIVTDPWYRTIFKMIVFFTLSLVYARFRSIDKSSVRIVTQRSTIPSLARS